MSESSDSVYEMLWDCRYCGTKKLLGLTHRHCPSCGAPQNADERYFPADSEKVAVRDHVFSGADLSCRHCGMASGRLARHCGGCGAPLDGARDISRRNEQVTRAGESFAGQSADDARRERRGEPVPALAKPKASVGRRLGLGCLIVFVLAIGVVCAGFLWKRESGFQVTGHRWKREIAVERLGPVSDSAWCDGMPAGARSVRRSREVRSHERVQDGETCQTRRVDNGNGTFTERQECTPKYREEPVYADKCSFTVDRWSAVRSEVSEGVAVTDSPRWPTIAIARQGACEGCEREGKRHETYTVLLRDEAGKEHACELPEPEWGRFSDGASLSGQIRALTGGVDCGSLELR